MHFVFNFLTVATILYLVWKLEQCARKQESLDIRLRWAEARGELLMQFICESLALRDDATKFSERGYICRHDASSENHEKCVCTPLKGRMNSIRDRYEFHALLEKGLIDSDGDDDYHEDQARKHAKDVQQTILPYLKKLNQIAPETVTNEHLKWLMRAGRFDFQTAHFLGWFLPPLIEKFSAVKSEEGKRVLEELEGRLGGSAGALCHAAALYPKPVPEK